MTDKMRDAFFHAQQHINNHRRRKHGQYDRRSEPKPDDSGDAFGYAFGAFAQRYGKAEFMKWLPLMNHPLRPGQMLILTPGGQTHILDRSEWAV